MQQTQESTSQQQQQQHINANINSTNSQVQHNGNVATGTAAPNSPGSTGATGGGAGGRAQISGGRFDFEDGGTYCGGWEEGKAHGHGVCTGPKHQGAYSGAWNYGFEVSGVYIWPSGSSFEGQWQNGRRHGLGVETRGRWIYRGEWTSGSKGRYGVRQSATSTAKYEGTWAAGLQDGYGSETYADGGSYQGQWQEGKRHGYGVRTSAPFGLASHYRPKNLQASMTSLRSNEEGKNDPSEKRNHRMDEIRGGFVLKARSDEPPARRNSLVEKTRKGLLSGLKLKKQRSTGDLEKRGTGASGSIRSTVSTASWISTGSSQSAMSNKSVHTDSNASFTVDEEHLDPSVTEVYMGEWKRDKRDGYGISERSDGLKYEGEWHNNKKHGYGVTTFRDGTKEEGKYKYNVLITSQKKKHLFLIRSAKFRERIEAAVSSSQRASKYALQKADIAVSRTATARGKGEMADNVADSARVDSEIAVATAREFAPDFKPSVLDRFERIRVRDRYRSPPDLNPHHVKPPLIHAATIGGTPNHHSAIDNRTQHSNDTTPQKQTTFSQPSIRRSSLLQKQASVDYSSMANTSVYTQQSQQNQPNMSTSGAYGNPMHPNMPSATAAGSLASQYNQYSHQNTDPGGGPGPSSSSNYTAHTYPDQSNQTNSYNYTTNIQRPQQNYGGGAQQNAYGPPQPQQSPYNNTNNQTTQMNQSYPNYYAGPSNNYPLEQNYAQQAYGQQKPYDPNEMQQQHQQQLQDTPGHSNLRRNSRPLNENARPPMLGNYSQSSIDHYDHYKRPPSRDSSVDRYARAAGRLSGSRQPSVDRTAMANNQLTTATATSDAVASSTLDRNVRAGSAFRTTPTVTGAAAGPSTASATGNGTVMTGMGAAAGSRAATPLYQMAGAQPVYSSPNQPFEDVLLRQRTLGQDIIPSPREPKRTESLYLPPKPLVAAGAGAGGGGSGKGKLKSVPIALPLSRKKSLPDVQELPRATGPMSREEVSALGSARREEVRRQIEISERLKANPLLYLVSPQVKDWFSRQQLVMLVLIVNIALAIMFFKILT